MSDRERRKMNDVWDDGWPSFGFFDDVGFDSIDEHFERAQ